MSESFKFLAYYQEPDSSLRNPESMIALVIRLRQAGYVLTDGYAQPFNAPDNIVEDANAWIRDQYNQSPKIVAGVFWQYPFEATLSLDLKGCYWLLDIANWTLVGQQHNLGRQNAQHFLTVLRMVLEHYSPFYGCGFDLSYQDPPPMDVTPAWSVSTIYPVNFFSSSYITKHLDEARLAATPAWCNQKVNGGTLLVPGLDALYRHTPDVLASTQLHLGWQVV